MWRVLIANDAPDEHAARGYGIPFCPVDLSALGLPIDFEVRLHNQLFHMRIASPEDATKRTADIQRAIRTAMNISVKAVQDAYRVE